MVLSSPFRSPHYLHMLKVIIFIALALSSSARVFASDYSSADLKGEQDGIPMYYISVETLQHSDADIKIDGVVDEPTWKTIPAFDYMLVSSPATGEPGDYKTETRLLATEKGLYVSSIMHQPKDSVQVKRTRRDQQTTGDNFGFTLDTTGAGTFAYWFSVGLGGSVMDGKVLPERRYSTDWDGPWFSQTAIIDEGWSVEIFYPWSMFSMTEVDGPRQIGFAISRNVGHKNQRYYWPGHTYSSPQFVTALNTMQINGVQPVQQVSVIPYVSLTADNAREDNDGRAGADFSWKPSAKAEISASLFPDFGAVESDDVVLNLTALETFFPEKRLFFLEGNEVFVTTPRANSGNSLRELTNEDFSTTSRRVFVTEYLNAPVSLLNTRRIGGVATQASIPAGITPLRGEAGLRTDLLGAAKVTGANGAFRYGVLAAFEDNVELRGVDALGNEVGIEDEGRDFGIVRLSYEKSEDDRFAIGYLGTLTDGPLYSARVDGLDFHYGTGDGKWAADVQFVNSDVDDITGQGFVVGLDYSADSQFQHLFRFDYFDEDVNISDLGFLQRNDYKGAQYVFRYAYPTVGDFLKSARGAINIDRRYNISEGQAIDSGIYWRNTMVLPGRNTVRTAIAFLPSRYEDIDSRGNGAYKAEDRFWWNVHLNTNSEDMLSWTVAMGAIQEDLGDWTHQYWVGVTARPTESVSIDLDVKYKRRDGWIVYQGANNFGAYNGVDWQPTLEVNWFMAPRHQLRFKMQWAGVRVDEQGFFAVPLGDGKLTPATRIRTDHDFTVSLLAAQLRYRWAIAPLTDLYVVYNRGNRLPDRTEDEFSSLFKDSFEDPTIDSLIVKLRYRFGN
jgi:hypothetical protein